MQVVSSPASGWIAHRATELVLTITDADGRPLSDAAVTIEQTSHAFGFGNIGFDLVGLANGSPEGAGTQQLADLYVDLFNRATLPFYWGEFEHVRGVTATRRLHAAARWFAEQGVAVKGHPLVWHTVQPDWLLGLPLEQVEQLLRQRIRREVAAFRDVISSWDAINEVVIMPEFTHGANAITPLARARGRGEMVRLAIDEAREADPRATLLINDFDLSVRYERVIDEVLSAGVRLDAIGLQTHMHQGYRGEDAVLAVVDRFARFGLPLHFTETSLVSGELMPAHIDDLNDYVVESWPSTAEGEARQADEIERHYRSLAGHPAVEAITYWGITDAGAWLGAPIGLVRADGTRKPSYDALHSLIKREWWLAPTVAHTDDAGRVAVRGWRGEYAVTGPGGAAVFRLDEGPDRTSRVALA